MKKPNAGDVIALVLVIVGGLNWGLVGFFEWDLVAAIFGEGSAVARIVYGLVGLAALYIAVSMPSKMKGESAPAQPQQ